MFTSKTRDLMVGDVLHVQQDNDYVVVAAPKSGGPNGRLIFQARAVDSEEVQEHHAQPDFEWEVNR